MVLGLVGPTKAPPLGCEISAGRPHRRADRKRNRRRGKELRQLGRFAPLLVTIW